MRHRRFKLIGQTAVYHCISRIVGKEFLIQEDRFKNILQKQIFQVADFCGVEILTYCIMSNHFHVLLRVPVRDPEAISCDELLRRLRVLYNRSETNLIFWESRLADPITFQAAKDQLLTRMGDVSAFMKELKQRFSICYNRNQARVGTLWAERFKSILVENTARAMLMVAAYIDLNPVRAGLVAHPKDYRWCGFHHSFHNPQCRLESPLYAAYAHNKLSPDQAFQAYSNILSGVAGLSPQDPPIKPFLEKRIVAFSNGAMIGSVHYLKECSGIPNAPPRKPQNRGYALPVTCERVLRSFRRIRQDVQGKQLMESSPNIS
jgi:REP element-mobilizing transposase RayT